MSMDDETRSDPDAWRSLSFSSSRRGPGDRIGPSSDAEKPAPNRPVAKAKPGAKAGQKGPNRPGAKAGGKGPGKAKPGPQNRLNQQMKKGQGAANKAKAAAELPVPPVASASRPRRRHWFVLLSFVQVVLLPLAICTWYLYAVAADQYASYLGFSVRTEEKSSAIELLGGITELSGSSSSDTDILFAYLTSQELVRKADESVDLRAIWSRVPVGEDPVFSFDPNGSIEDLLKHWERKVSIIYDSATGMIDLRILSFDPADSRRIAAFLLDECSKMINNLSAIAREDAIKYARDELEGAVERLKTARRDVTEFRNRNQIVDPTIDTQNQMGLLITLQQQLAEALIEVDLLKETTRENDPRILQAQRRVAVIEDRIDAERRKLGIGAEATGGDVFADIVGEFESLVVERQFAEEAYVSALAAYDAARTEARRQSRYLAAHVPPTLAESAEFPERAKNLGLIGLLLFVIWSIAVLLYYSLRDRR
ncbi:capsule biosynthesis protein [Marimonas arenosa]|uniref:Capsule biosynthesis protein n=1 Tax=Marimonas arenosa TaxID=1795305 RepID=A0AAE3WCF2_9RHOB|nr:capsule biosynthesis protein [Marimonas arenosa]MDQ2090059.1 capsule biosynthesis protein [Marimonas arenosa]